MTNIEEPLNEIYDAHDIVLLIESALGDKIDYVEQVIKGSEKGNNFMSIVYRAFVKYKDSEDKQWLFIKDKPKKGDQITEWANFQIAFQNEINSYKLFSDMTWLPIPKVISLNEDFIIMEDLQSQGYKMEQKSKGLNKRQTEIVLENLAKFHSKSINLRVKNPNLFSIIGSKFNYLMLRQSLMPKSNDLINMTKNRIGPLSIDINKKIDQYLTKDIFNEIFDFYNIYKGINNNNKNDHKLIGLIHGDCWTNNMMFKEKIIQNENIEMNPHEKEIENKNKNLTTCSKIFSKNKLCINTEKDKCSEKDTLIDYDIKFLDFQSVYINTVLIDLIILLISSINLPILIEYFPHFIHHYHHHLNIPDISEQYIRNQLVIHKHLLFSMFLFRGWPAIPQADDELVKNNFKLYIEFLKKYNLF